MPVCVLSDVLMWSAVACAGESEISGLTDEEKPRMRGPKRASKIRKLFNLGKDDDVRKCVTTPTQSLHELRALLGLYVKLETVVSVLVVCECLQWGLLNMSMHCMTPMK